MQEGDLVAERFLIEARSGEGAMGTVFRARDRVSSELVALKTFRIDAALPFPPRIAREVAALSELTHDGVVRYVAHGVSGGQPFLAMAWIDGPTLGERLAARGVSPGDALRLAQRLAGALAALHARGIVHRDLKPSNIMLPDDCVERACIVDFGVARVAGSAAVLTADGAQLGTPRYMAPEQIRDPHTVDGRADVFALGCVLFECLTGAPAFGGDDPVAVLAQILFQPAPEPSSLQPALPPTIDDLLARTLARKAEARPTAAELVTKLAALLDSDVAAVLDALPPARAVRRALTAPGDPPPAVVLTATAEHGLPPLRPSTEPRSLHAFVLQAALPHAGEPLIGRDAELAALTPALTGGAPIVIWGAAGMGKTRLAIELVERALAASPRSFEAVWVVDLSATRTTEEAVRRFAEHARLAIAAGDEPEARLASLLSKVGRAIALLDRVELLAGQVEPLLQLFATTAPELTIIVTSRVRLQLAPAFELGPLRTRAIARAPRSTPPQVAQEPASELSAGARLMLERARASLPQLGAEAAIAPEARDALERIASALDGIPLAIELAAARAGLLGLEGLSQRLTAQLELLSAEARGRGGPATMREAIGWSFALLRPDERYAFMQCALFQDGFTPEAAEAVIALPPGAPPVLEVLRSLREQSLLVARAATPGAQRVRLSMYAALREYAREQLAAQAGDPLLSGAALRHARYFAVHGAERLADERGNLTAAAEYALAALPPDGESALHALIALEPALLAGGPGSELALLLTQAIDVTQGAREARLLAQARLLRARLSVPSDLAGARRDLAPVLALAERAHDRALAARAWLELGVAHHFARELDEARNCYETALAQLAESDDDDPVSEARCHGNLAALLHDHGELERAVPGYRRAIALLDLAAEPRALANFCGNLALCERELGQVDAARAHYARAIALLEGLGDARLLGIVLGNLGTLELAAGSPERALALHERACALLERGGDARSEGLGLARRAAALARVERLEDAERHMARAERVLRRDPLGRATAELLRAYLELGFARQHRRAGAFDRADAELAAAQARLDTAAASARGSAAQATGDDLRAYLRLLVPELERERTALQRERGAARDSGAA